MAYLLKIIGISKKQKKKEVVSNSGTTFSLCVKPRLSQARALLLPKVFCYGKVLFSLLHTQQIVFFPQRIDENIAANDPVRIVNAVVDNLNLDNF